MTISLRDPAQGDVGPGDTPPSPRLWSGVLTVAGLCSEPSITIKRGDAVPSRRIGSGLRRGTRRRPEHPMVEASVRYADGAGAVWALGIVLGRQQRGVVKRPKGRLSLCGLSPEAQLLPLGIRGETAVGLQ